METSRGGIPLLVVPLGHRSIPAQLGRPCIDPPQLSGWGAVATREELGSSDEIANVDD
jgi:hypothetical protein